MNWKPLQSAHVGAGFKRASVGVLQRFLARGALAAAICAMTLPAITDAEAQARRQVPQNAAQVALSFAPVVREALPAVVNVYAQRAERLTGNPLLDDPFFRQFFGAQPRQSRSLGSGVIVDPEGLVVTNYHVIADMTDVRVALADQREFEAEVILRDKRTDLAVLRMKGARKFPSIAFGDSDALEVGDIVLAIGNPFGVGQTVTQGIVSGLARTRTGITDYSFFIQTDAAINPGNSGGALVDIHGKLAGINTAIYSRSGGSIGIGFAIPVNMVRTVVAAAREGGRVQRPWVGATVQHVSSEIAESLGLDRPTGALVTRVFAGSSSERAGLRRGDVILQIEGMPVTDPESFGYRLATRQVGGETTLEVLRQGRKMTLRVGLETAPEQPPRQAVTLTGPSPLAGATIYNYSPAVAEELSVEGEFTEAVVIAELGEASAAQRVGLLPGDVVLAVNDQKVTTTQELERLTRARRPYWKLTINRKGQVLNSVFGG